MATRIDQAGVYRGPLVEAGLGLTKNKYPQFVCRLKAEEKWVDDPEGLEHFGLTEPAWVPWAEYDEDITAYNVLFNDPNEFSEETALLSYEQLQTALGWDGTEFDSLNDDTYVGKRVVFRIEEEEYQGKVSLRVKWIDPEDASPVRELRKLDAESVKALAKNLKIKKAVTPAVAKPAAAKPKAASAAAKPKADSKPKPQAEAEPPKAADESEAKAPAPPATPKPAPQPEPEPEQSTLCDKLTAWETVVNNRGGNTVQDVEAAWIDACQKVANGRDEDQLTDEDWTAVRDAVVESLVLDV